MSFVGKSDSDTGGLIRDFFHCLLETCFGRIWKFLEYSDNAVALQVMFFFVVVFSGHSSLFFFWSVCTSNLGSLLA